ncbi:MAG: transcription antitermination factor NusB [Lachnospiraceae bacterium]|nr:transcription antitermination factor NusB [Lachnospiraceae bacterium]
MAEKKMGKDIKEINRRKRIWLLQLLFEQEYYEASDIEEMLCLFKESFAVNDDPDDEDVVADTNGDFDSVADKFRNMFAKLGEIDSVIEKLTVGWKLDRIGKCELQAIRIAVYEIYFSKDTPVKVSVNEAVELAKMFGNENGGAFVNGVLAKSEAVKATKQEVNE